MSFYSLRLRSFLFPRLVLVCLMLLVLARAQQAPPEVAFTCDFPGSDPSHYGISVRSDGHASYVSDGKLAKDADSDEPFRMEFTVSPATTARIFDIAKKANYFAGDIDSKKKNIASTGSKTLVYKDAQRNTVATYNYSPVPAIEEITTLFQGLSTTLEFGRRLEYDYRYQKLALDEELKRMDDLSGRGGVPEVAAIAPILQKIMNDPSVINGVRARAQRLLERDGAGK